MWRNIRLAATGNEQRNELTAVRAPSRLCRHWTVAFYKIIIREDLEREGREREGRDGGEENREGGR
jgi:hypothetical protein